MTPFERVIARLDELGIAYRLMHHAPTLTSLDAARERGVDASLGAKSLVVKSKDGFALFVVPGDSLLDWVAVKGAGFRKPRLADDEELLTATGLTKGSVPPFGNLFGLPVFIDREVTEKSLVQFNAGSLTDSVEIEGAALQRATDGTIGSFPGVSTFAKRLALPELCAQFDIVGAVAGWSVSGQRSVMAHGLADNALGTALTRDTLMMAGSVTKAITASIVAMLVDEGAVDLDAPARTYLPEFRVVDDGATRTITSRHLLTHTSGFDGDVWFDVGEGADAIDRFVSELAHCRQLSRPGEHFSYNNAAYSVLGQLIQLVTGTSFEEALQSRIADPAGASFTTDPAKAHGRPAAIGHVPDASGQQVPIGTALGPACLAPAGSRTWATIDDLLAFGELHLGRHGGAAEHRALTAMRTPQVFVNDPNNGGEMALGMFLDDRWGTPVVFHDGGVQGQSAYLRILPEFDAVLVVMSTGGVPQVFHRHVFARMAELFPGVHAPLGVEPRPNTAIDPSRYIGRFEAASTRIDVEHDGEGLTAAITWGYDTPDAVATGELRMTPHSAEVFLAPLAGRDYVLVYPDLQQPADHLLAGLRRVNRVR